jgi:hypothetical protein
MQYEYHKPNFKYLRGDTSDGDARIWSCALNQCMEKLFPAEMHSRSRMRTTWLASAGAFRAYATATNQSCPIIDPNIILPSLRRGHLRGMIGCVAVL